MPTWYPQHSSCSDMLTLEGKKKDGYAQKNYSTLHENYEYGNLIFSDVIWVKMCDKWPASNLW